MGIFSFIKSAGEALGIGGGDPTADDIKKAIDSHGLGSEGVQVEVQGDKAVITGEVKDKSVLEKVILAAGNVLGIGTVESKARAADEAGADSEFYTVKKGDTLWKISEAQYGKGKGGKYNVIFEANRPMLTHPDKIYPGQVLRIPPL